MSLFRAINFIYALIRHWNFVVPPHIAAEARGKYSIMVYGLVVLYVVANFIPARWNDFVIN